MTVIYLYILRRLFFIWLLNLHPWVDNMSTIFIVNIINNLRIINFQWFNLPFSYNPLLSTQIIIIPKNLLIFAFPLNFKSFLLISPNNLKFSLPTSFHFRLLFLLLLFFFNWQIRAINPILILSNWRWYHIFLTSFWQFTTSNQIILMFFVVVFDLLLFSLF